MSSKHFHTIKVSEVKKSTEDCSIISLDVPNELKEQFKFKQGQYLTLETLINGEEVRRSYSLCSSPMDNEWKVGVKKVHNGKFSTYANEILKAGDSLEVMVPKGSFYVETNPALARNYIAFAAGSGITPIISIIKTHLASEPKSSFKLFYFNKTVASIILKEELESLKNQYMDRLEIFYFLSKQQRNISFLNGRLDPEKLDTIFKDVCDLSSIDHFFTCGPEKMNLLVKDYLIGKAVDKSKVHFELFNTTETQNKTEEIDVELIGKKSSVTVLEGGKSFKFEMAQASNNILDAALNNNADLPFACKGGVCATCKAKLVEGDVKMKVHYGLEDDEVENGYILTCQSYPCSDKIVVDYDI
jgi:ring-1,2-phenylacetyl-CoA epoxidase subunit PaaE